MGSRIVPVREQDIVLVRANLVVGFPLWMGIVQMDVAVGEIVRAMVGISVCT